MDMRASAKGWLFDVSERLKGFPIPSPGALPDRWLAVDGVALPRGKVLSLGSHDGRNELWLANHNIDRDVTGVEEAARLVDKARERAATRPPIGKVRFVQGDATRLQDLTYPFVPKADRLYPPYICILDIGCYHTMQPKERARFAKGVNAVTEPGTWLVQVGFEAGRAPWPFSVAGWGFEDIESLKIRFHHWNLEQVTVISPEEFAGNHGYVHGWGPVMWQLRRRGLRPLGFGNTTLLHLLWRRIW